MRTFNFSTLRVQNYEKKNSGKWPTSGCFGPRIPMEIPGYRRSLLPMLKYSNMSTRL